MYDSGFTATLPGNATSTSKNHYIGVPQVDAQFVIECTTNNASYVVGDQIDSCYLHGTDGTIRTMTLANTRLTSKFQTPDSGSFIGLTALGVGIILTAGSWKYCVRARRSW